MVYLPGNRRLVIILHRFYVFVQHFLYFCCSLKFTRFKKKIDYVVFLYVAVDCP